MNQLNTVKLLGIVEEMPVAKKIDEHSNAFNGVIKTNKGDIEYTAYNEKAINIAQACKTKAGVEILGELRTDRWISKIDNKQHSRQYIYVKECKIVEREAVNVEDCCQIAVEGRATFDTATHKHENPAQDVPVVLIANNKYFKKNDQWEASTTFIEVAGRDATREKLLAIKKGDPVVVRGSLEGVEYMGKDNKKHHSYHIEAAEIEVKERRREKEGMEIE